MKDKEKGKKVLKKWIGSLCKEVFESGFQMYYSDKLTETRMRVFCSENLLFNILELIRKNTFTTQEIQLINQYLINDQCTYFLMKYPKSEEAEVNLNFAKVITEIDNL